MLGVALAIGGKLSEGHTQRRDSLDSPWYWVGPVGVQTPSSWVPHGVTTIHPLTDNDHALQLLTYGKIELHYANGVVSAEYAMDGIRGRRVVPIVDNDTSAMRLAIVLAMADVGRQQYTMIQYL